MLDCQNKKNLVAGATGYLGQYLVKELKRRGAWVRVLIRRKEQTALFSYVDDCYLSEATDLSALCAAFVGIDWVVSSLGITRQLDGFTYMDVDFGANFNLLQCAIRHNVKGFQYVSAINADKHRDLKIFEAKELFVDKLKASGLNYSIIRPNGFFSDMGDFLKMAERGTVFLFGKGDFKLNPIHGEDLAVFCVDNLLEGKTEKTVGGLDVLTQNEIAALALCSLKKPLHIFHLPDWVRKLVLAMSRNFTSQKVYGPIEFFLTMMAEDTIAPEYGRHHLRDYFQEEARKCKC